MQNVLNVLFYTGWAFTLVIGFIGIISLMVAVSRRDTESNSAARGCLVLMVVGLVVAYVPQLIYNLLN